MDDNKDLNNDRRALMGGHSKPTFMAVAGHSVGEDFAGMLYDILRDLKACQVRQSKKCTVCYEEFDEKYLRKAHKKLPLSWPEFIFTILIAGALVTLGMIDMDLIINVLKAII